MSKGYGVRRGERTLSRFTPSFLFLVALAYFAAFVGYGFQVEDEGTMLFQLDRAARGQLPYLDFHTGYTPGFFTLGALALQVADYSIVALRVGLAFLNAAIVAGVFLVARRVSRTWGGRSTCTSVDGLPTRIRGPVRFLQHPLPGVARHSGLDCPGRPTPQFQRTRGTVASRSGRLLDRAGAGVETGRRLRSRWPVPCGRCVSVPGHRPDWIADC